MTEALETDLSRYKIQELFKNGKLLARVMDSPAIHRTEKGFELTITPWEDELAFMERAEGMSHVSSTLILPDKQIPMYIKAYGLLFDANKVNIEHVAKQDSGSMAGYKGELLANQTDFSTLDELVHYYSDTRGAQSMNEVNITAKREAVVGLVIRSGVTDPSTFLGLAISKKFLFKKGLDLSIFQYDERQGVLTNFKLPKESDLLDKLRPETRKLFSAKISELSD